MCCNPCIGDLNVRTSDLPFDFAQGGEPASSELVESAQPFRISIFEIRAFMPSPREKQVFLQRQRI
jgi:hypothetical protein